MTCRRSWSLLTYESKLGCSLRLSIVTRNLLFVRLMMDGRRREIKISRREARPSGGQCCYWFMRMKTGFREEIGVWLGWLIKDLEHGQRKGYGWWVSLREQNRIRVNPRGNWDVEEACGASWWIIVKEYRAVRASPGGLTTKHNGDMESVENMEKESRVLFLNPLGRITSLGITES